MNKILIALICIIGINVSAIGQVGIGTSSPDASAALDVTAADKGLLMPRMTTAQRTAISSPANSLMVFDTDTNSYWSYIEGAWVEDKPGTGKFIDGASPEIAFYDGRVGIGIDNLSTVHKLYVESVKTTDGIHTGTVLKGAYDGTGTSSLTNGLAVIVENNSTGSISSALGSRSLVENLNPGGTIDQGVGSYGSIENSGTITTAVASWPRITNRGNINYAAGFIASTTNTTGTINLTRGIDIGVKNESAGTMTQPSLASFYFTNEGTITGDGYGLFIGGAGGGSVGGNSYALYLSTPFSNVAGDAFALYSDNTNNSYLAGNVGFGETDPQQTVHISGVMRLEPQGSAPAGGLGDLYVNTNGTLFFHNGTEWKAVQLAP